MLKELLEHPSLILYAMNHPNEMDVRRQYWMLQMSYLRDMFLELDRSIQFDSFTSSDELLDTVLPSTFRKLQPQERASAYYATIYLVIRFLQPSLSIETGVFYGFSSWTILQALQKINQEQSKVGLDSRLISIDLPQQQHRRFEDRDAGSAVPTSLRARWDFRLGDSKVLLPQILMEQEQKGNRIDFFLHDSDHRYDHFMFELNTIFPALRKGAAIMADDVELNNAFVDFCTEKKLSYRIFEKLSIEKSGVRKKFGLFFR
jgi:hypothetical protein